MGNRGVELSKREEHLDDREQALAKERRIFEESMEEKRKALVVKQTALESQLVNGRCPRGTDLEEDLDDGTMDPLHLFGTVRQEKPDSAPEPTELGSESSDLEALR